MKDLENVIKIFGAGALVRLARLEVAVQRLQRGRVPDKGSDPVATTRAAAAGRMPATDLEALATLCYPGCSVTFSRGLYRVWAGTPAVQLSKDGDAFVAARRSWQIAAPRATLPRYIERALARDVIRPCRRCRRMIPPQRRSDARYCSDPCKGAFGREKGLAQAARRTGTQAAPAGARAH